MIIRFTPFRGHFVKKNTTGADKPAFIATIIKTILTTAFLIEPFHLFVQLTDIFSTAISNWHQQ